MRAKVCVECCRAKPFSRFYVDNSRTDRRKAKCAKCSNQYYQRWFSKNSEARELYWAKYQKKNAKLLAEKQREYRRANPVRVKDANRKYYKEHREEILARQTNHRRDHPEVYRPIAVRASQNRRAREARAPGIITRGTIETLKRSMPVCQKCGAADRLEIDHVVPLVLGGTNYIDNLQVLCKSCNSNCIKY